MFARRYSVSGVTLIELMISIAMSFLIFDALITMYLAAEKNHALQSALNAVQENAMAALEFLRADIHAVNNLGCVRLGNNVPVVNHTNFNFITGIVGTDDAITMSHVSTKNAVLIDDTRDHSKLAISVEIPFKKGSIAIISNCSHREIFSIKEIYEDKNIMKITTNQPLNYLYEKNTKVRLLENNKFFISDTGRKTQNKKTINALYVENISNRKTELVEGIDDIQLRYDIEDDGNIIYVNADQVSDWSKVLGINISLRVNSADNYFLQKTWHSYAAL